MDAYSHTHESEYLDRAMAAYRVAVMCETAPASERFCAAKLWARHADFTHESALDAYHAAIELLPRLAMLGLDLQSRQQALTSGSDGLARDAAACAIRSGHYNKAVELLEEGRAVFWSQALQLRTPMKDLRKVAPELEDKLRHISLILEQGSLRDVSRSLSDSPQIVMEMEKDVSRFRRLNEEWLAVLEEVRRLEGFRDFLRPSRFSTLQQAAASGSLVILNASTTGCAALILTVTGVQHMPFPDLSLTEVTKLVKLLRCAIGQGGRYASPPELGHTYIEGLVRQMLILSGTLRLGRMSNISARPDDIFRYVLAVLWESIVKPVVESLGLRVN